MRFLFIEKCLYKPEQDDYILQAVQKPIPRYIHLVDSEFQLVPRHVNLIMSPIRNRNLAYPKQFSQLGLSHSRKERQKPLIYIMPNKTV